MWKLFEGKFAIFFSCFNSRSFSRVFIVVRLVNNRYGFSKIYCYYFIASLKVASWEKKSGWICVFKWYSKYFNECISIASQFTFITFVYFAFKRHANNVFKIRLVEPKIKPKLLIDVSFRELNLVEHCNEGKLLAFICVSMATLRIDSNELNRCRFRLKEETDLQVRSLKYLRRRKVRILRFDNISKFERT